MKYFSTRDPSQQFSFEQVVLLGLAKDGGLFIPSSIPKVSKETLEHWATLDYVGLAYEIFRLYIDPTEISDQDLRQLIQKSYSTFTHPKVTPVEKIKEDMWILELFHGPTFAFKDVALQFLGNLFEFFLKKDSSRKLTILGATSGDTGGAAIYGLKGKENIQVFILHPHNRISPIQELQMATVLEPNIHNVALEGSFDDCQDIVKAAFASHRDVFQLGAINSINWARILAQIVYYFYAYFQVGPCRFAVPTGNFGDILAGFYAKSMGLDIPKLIIATNDNDILHRFLLTGSYTKSDVVAQTLSPAMDILISSNFERMLWYLLSDPSSLVQLMKDLKEKNGFSVDSETLKRAREIFASQNVTNQQTTETIHKYYHEYNVVLDPHTAIGVYATDQLPPCKTVCLATASPGKFPDAVLEAINKNGKFITFEEFAPKPLQGLEQLPKRLITIPTGGNKSLGFDRVIFTINQLLK